MRITVTATVICASLIGPAASAQVPTKVTQGAGVGAGAGPGASILFSEPLDIAAPVIGRPYTADTLTVTTQILPNGTRIERRAHGSVARDSEGNIRRVQSLSGLGSAADATPIVTIVSPADRVQFRLDEARSVAYRLRLPPATTTAPLPRKLSAGLAIKTEGIGSRVIAGVRADGTRTTTTLPIGAVGNDRPIEIVNERWFSPELQVVVQTRRVDPRVGETVYELVNITREEPPKHLFEVPADYLIEDQRPILVKRPPDEPQ
jgi:hypothetical protein